MKAERLALGTVRPLTLGVIYDLWQSTIYPEPIDDHRIVRYGTVGIRETNLKIRGEMTTLLSGKIKGIIPALPTPLTDDGRVDEQGLATLINYVIEGGVHGIWVLGSSGEFPSFSAEERRRIIEVAVSTARNASRKVFVMVGLTDNDVRTVIRYAEDASSIGADACFVSLPFYFALDPVAALCYFTELAAACHLPLIIYDNPTATGVKLSAKDYYGLLSVPNILGLKDSSSDFARFQDLILTLGPRCRWTFLQGDERLVGASLLCGSNGSVAALASIAPSLFVNMYECAIKKNVDGVVELQTKVLSLIRLLDLNGDSSDGMFFAGLKAALQVLGISGRTVAKPFRTLPEGEMVQIERILRDCGVLS